MRNKMVYKGLDSFRFYIHGIQFTHHLTEVLGTFVGSLPRKERGLGQQAMLNVIDTQVRGLFKA